MLILTRRVGEKLMIGDDVTVTIGGVAGRRAVLDMARSGRSETEVVAIGGMLTVDDDVTVTVLDIRGRQVRLGVTAPKEIPVHREEIYVRIQEEKKEKDCA